MSLVEPVPPPVRHRVCLGCRTLLGKGETCGAKKGHAIAALDRSADRARLDDEVWGPDSRARKLRQAAKVGAGGGAFGGFLQGCNACDALQGLEGCGNLADAGEGIVAVLVFIVAAAAFAIVAALVGWLVMALVRWIRARMDKPKPHGALRKPPKASGRTHGTGAVSGQARVALPWKSGDALAYALELHTKTAFGGGALLRDAVTAGFDVTLDDGVVVRMPPGRVTIVGSLPPAEIERGRVDRFLGDIDPRHDADVADVEEGAEKRALFPYDFARAVEIGPGDRVEVLGELERTADGAQGHGYRASAGLMTPVGVPVLRVRQRIVDGPPPSAGAKAKAHAAAEAQAEASAEAEAEAEAEAGRGGEGRSV
jgi:hypothetical protein